MQDINVEIDRSNAPRPVLKTLRLKAFACDNQLPPGKVRLQIKITKTIAVGLEQPQHGEVNEKRSDLAGAVQIEFVAEFRDDQGAIAQGISASAKYEFSFGFSDGVTFGEIEQRMEDEGYRYHFVAQAHPLAMSHFKSQMSAMGFALPEVTLGIG